MTSGRGPTTGPRHVVAWQDRLLGLVGHDEPEVASSRLAAFSRAFVLCVACEVWFEVSNLASFGRPTGAHAMLAAGLSVGAALVWLGMRRQAALAALAALLWVRVVAGFPEAANHHLWEALIGSLLAFLRLDTAGERLVLAQSLRWLVVVPLVFAGVQKAVHGLWFRGEFLAFMVATKASFATALAPLLPADELQRLRGLAMTEGAGPFRPQGAPVFVLVSNLAWIAEIGCGLGLLVPRLRRFAWVGGIVLLLAIEAAAREFFFGSTMVGLLLLYARRDLSTRILPALVALYAFCLAMVTGIVPRGVFH